VVTQIQASAINIIANYNANRAIYNSEITSMVTKLHAQVSARVASASRNIHAQHYSLGINASELIAHAAPTIEDLQNTTSIDVDHPPLARIGSPEGSTSPTAEAVVSGNVSADQGEGDLELFDGNWNLTEDDWATIVFNLDLQ
jgi:hypothetical protein